MRAALINWWYRGGGGGSPYLPEYQAVLDYAALKGFSPPPTDAGKQADNDFLAEAISIGLYDAAPRLYNHHTEGDSGYACIDYKTPSDSTLALKVNSPAYTPKTGFTGNASSAYLNYQWTPITDGLSLYTLDDAGILTYFGLDVDVTGMGYGASSSGNVTMRPKFSNSIRWEIQSSAITSSNAISAIGLYDMRRESSTLIKMYKDNSILGSTLTASTGLPNTYMVGLARNVSGSLNLFCANRLDCFIPYKATSVLTADNKTMWDNHRSRVAAL